MRGYAFGQPERKPHVSWDGKKNRRWAYRSLLHSSLSFYFSSTFEKKNLQNLRRRDSGKLQLPVLVPDMHVCQEDVKDEKFVLSSCQPYLS